MQDRVPRVKNRAPNVVQLTAEQLLRDAQECQESQFHTPGQCVEDYEELHEYRDRKREDFEKRAKQTRRNTKGWLQYAKWEADQNGTSRSRSVFERALDADSRSPKLWLSYTEMELKSQMFSTHAIFLIEQLLYYLALIKYVYLEELLQNISGARQIFECWTQWEPDNQAWQAYIKFEQRYNELDRASAIYERWVTVRAEPRIWAKWGKIEEERGNLAKAREVYQSALDSFGNDEEQLDEAQAVLTPLLE